MKIKALSNNVVIRVDATPEKIGSIKLPDSYQDQDRFVTGIVLDVGPGREDLFIGLSPNASAKVFSKPPVKSGDRVIVKRFAIESQTKDGEGNDIAIFDAHNLLALIEE